MAFPPQDVNSVFVYKSAQQGLGVVGINTASVVFKNRQGSTDCSSSDAVISFARSFWASTTGSYEKVRKNEDPKFNLFGWYKTPRQPNSVYQMVITEVQVFYYDEKGNLKSFKRTATDLNLLFPLLFIDAMSE